MTLVIIVILLLGLLLIASAHLTHVNKAAIAVFMGTVCWVLYICYGADYVMSFHQLDYLGFLEGAKALTSLSNFSKQEIVKHCCGVCLLSPFYFQPT